MCGAACRGRPARTSTGRWRSWPSAITPALRHSLTINHYISFVMTTELLYVLRSMPRPARTHKRWPLAQLAELHHARFLLQPCALELFLADRTTALLCFGSPEVCQLAAFSLREHCVTHHTNQSICPFAVEW